MKWTLRLLLACNIVLSSDAIAFVGSIRKNYVTCGACHLDYRGGGTLTAYGRGAGDEFLPAFKYDGEGDALYGLTEANPYFLLGGDQRFIYLERRNSDGLSRRFFPMQLDVEPGILIGKMSYAVLFGLYSDYSFQIRRAYGLYQWDSGWKLKVGRFIPHYGLNVTNHTALIRDSLGFGQGREVEALEFGVQGDIGEVFLGAFKTAGQEGVNGRVSWFWGNNFYLGMSGLWERTFGDTYRIVYGPYLSYGFPKNWILAEIDHEIRLTETGAYDNSRGVGYLQYGRDMFPGVQLTLTGQGVINDKIEPSSKFTIGVGLIPRPHYEITFDYGIGRSNGKWDSVGLWQFHTWL